MSIDIYLKEVKQAIKKKNFSLILQKIRDVREKYPLGIRIDDLILKSKLELLRKSNFNQHKINTICSDYTVNEAVNKLKKLLDSDKTNSHIYAMIGNLYGQKQLFEKAKNHQEIAIKLNPFEYTYYVNLSETLDKIGDFRYSIRILNMGRLINPKSIIIEIRLARNFYNLKQFKKSYSIYEKIIRENKNQDYKFEYCKKLLTTKNIKKVYKILEELSHLDHTTKYLHILGLVYFTNKQVKLAEKIFKKCLNLDKSNPIYFSLLALCYEHKSDYDVAKKYHIKALEISQNNPTILKNFADHLYFVGDLKNAQKNYENVVKFEKTNFEASYFLGLLQLLNCQFEEGWKNFEYRWLSHSFDTNNKIIDAPLFKNLQNQKKILVWHEQGIGDQILFSRFLNCIKKKNRTVYATVHKKLMDLFKHSFPEINFAFNIDDEEIDCQIPMGSLAKFFIKKSKDLDPLSEKYLNSSNYKIENFKNKLSEKKKICGVSWLSKNINYGNSKSISLEMLKKILLLPNYDFVDLQYGDTSAEREKFLKKYGVKIEKFEEIDNFNDILGLASIVNCCDLVLTISSTLPHLSGALGKKTFLMLPKGKGHLWYWSQNNKKSNWYKSVEIFQQSRNNHWENVIEKIYNKMSNKSLENSHKYQ